MPFDLQDPLQKAEFRALLSEAIDAWLDKQYIKFGKWTAAGIISALVAYTGYLYLGAHGFKL